MFWNLATVWVLNASDHVIELAKSSTVGEALFGNKINEIVSAMLNKQLEQELDKILSKHDKSEPITFDHLDDWCQLLLVVADQVPGVPQLSSKRIIKLTYRGLNIPLIEVKCLSDECMFRIWARVKSRAVAMGILPELQAEVLLGATSTPQEKLIPIDDITILNAI